MQPYFLDFDSIDFQKAADIFEQLVCVGNYAVIVLAYMSFVLPFAQKRKLKHQHAQDPRDSMDCSKDESWSRQL